MFRAETPEEKAAREAGQEEIPQPVAVVVPVVVVVRTPLKKTGGRPRKKPFEPLVETEPVNFDADEPEAKKVKRVNVKWSSDDLKVVFRVLKECGGNRARTIRSLNDNPDFADGRFEDLKESNIRLWENPHRRVPKHDLVVGTCVLHQCVPTLRRGVVRSIEVLPEEKTVA